MIQRVQTIFMLLVVIAMGVTIGSPVWEQTETVSGDTWSLTAFMLNNLGSSGEIVQSSSKWYLAALAAFAGMLALISIFQYKNRGRQMFLNMINSLVMVILIVVIFLTSNGVNSEINAVTGGTYEIGFWAVLAAMVFNMLANRFIRKDEALVRSVDRIR